MAGAALSTAGGFALKRALPLLAAWEGGQFIGGYANQGINWGLSKMTGQETSLGGLLYDLTHREQEKVGGEIRVKVDQDGRIRSVTASSDNPRVPMNVDTGHTMASP